MLIAVVVVIFLLLLFVLVTYILTSKTYSFDIEGGSLTIQNRGSHLRIFFQGKLIDDILNPQLIRGERYVLSINDKDVVILLRSSSLGYKLRIEIEMGGKIIADNGVKLREKKKKVKKQVQEKEDDDIQKNIRIM